MRLLFNEKRWNEIKKKFPNETFDRLNVIFEISLYKTEIRQLFYTFELERCSRYLKDLKQTNETAVSN